MNPGHFNYSYTSSELNHGNNTTILSFDESHFVEETKQQKQAPALKAGELNLSQFLRQDDNYFGGEQQPSMIQDDLQADQDDILEEEDEENQDL